MQIAHLVYAHTKATAKKIKRAIFHQCPDGIGNEKVNFENRKKELKYIWQKR